MQTSNNDEIKKFWDVAHCNLGYCVYLPLVPLSTTQWLIYSRGNVINGSYRCFINIAHQTFNGNFFLEQSHCEIVAVNKEFRSTFIKYLILCGYTCRMNEIFVEIVSNQAVLRHPISRRDNIDVIMVVRITRHNNYNPVIIA